MIIRKSDQKRIRITKIVGADLPWKRKNVAGVASLMLMLLNQMVLISKSTKNIKAGSRK
jgi:homoserine kinase